MMYVLERMLRVLNVLGEYDTAYNLHHQRGAQI